MKKEEALLLASEKTKVIIEYIKQILSIPEKVTGKMKFNSAKIDNQNMCTLDIYVPTKNFEKHINLGITIDHCDIFYKQLFNDLFETFIEHDTIGVSRYYEIKFEMAETFTGMNAVNSMGSEIKINFITKGSRFSEMAKEYNQRIKEYIEKINQQKTIDDTKKLR